MIKAQNKFNSLLLFTQNQRIFYLGIISHWPISFDYVGIKIIDYFQSTTTFWIMLSKDDFSFWWDGIWCFLLFEDKGRLHACCDRTKRGLLSGPGLGIRSFQKNVLIFPFFPVFYKRRERSFSILFVFISHTNLT